MKILLIILLMFHGSVHLLGFVKAFRLKDVPQLTMPISRPAGILWLAVAVLCIVSGVLLVTSYHSWWVVTGVALLLSQMLIFRSWADAKFGTMANIIILLPVLVGMLNAMPSSLQNRYRAEAERRLLPVSDSSVVRTGDLERLPGAVQKYLEYVGAVGKPKVHNFRAVFGGSMKRSVEGDWMKISSRQYNFFDGARVRLFAIESSLFGIPFDGLHLYGETGATMEIKVASILRVADAKGEKMTRSETVTLFNDMCLLAPATLIDSTIHWEVIDPLRVKASFANSGNGIAAVLVFSEEGALTDFLSDDRYLSEDGKTYTGYPWSTPVREYQVVGGRRVPLHADAVWHMPEGEYTYARFQLLEIEYNCQTFR